MLVKSNINGGHSRDDKGRCGVPLNE